MRCALQCPYDPECPRYRPGHCCELDAPEEETPNEDDDAPPHEGDESPKIREPEG